MDKLTKFSLVYQQILKQMNYKFNPNADTDDLIISVNGNQPEYDETDETVPVAKKAPMAKKAPIAKKAPMVKKAPVAKNNVVTSITAVRNEDEDEYSFDKKFKTIGGFIHFLYDDLMCRDDEDWIIEVVKTQREEYSTWGFTKKEMVDTLNDIVKHKDKTIKLITDAGFNNVSPGRPIYITINY